MSDATDYDYSSILRYISILFFSFGGACVIRCFIPDMHARMLPFLTRIRSNGVPGWWKGLRNWTKLSVLMVFLAFLVYSVYRCAVPAFLSCVYVIDFESRNCNYLLIFCSNFGWIRYVDRVMVVFCFFQFKLGCW